MQRRAWSLPFSVFKVLENSGGDYFGSYLKKKIKILWNFFCTHATYWKKGEKVTHGAGLSPFSSKFQEIILFLGFRNSEHVKKQLARRPRARNAGGEVDIRPDNRNVFICKVEEQIPFVVSSLQSLNHRTPFSQIRAQIPKMATFHQAIFPLLPRGASWRRFWNFLGLIAASPAVKSFTVEVFAAHCQFVSALG